MFPVAASRAPHTVPSVRVHLRSLPCASPAEHTVSWVPMTTLLAFVVSLGHGGQPGAVAGDGLVEQASELFDRHATARQAQV